MTPQPQDLYDMLDRIRYDLTAAQAKLTDVYKIIRELQIPDTPVTSCPKCGVKLRGPKTLAEHLYHSHDGPVPPHFVEIDELALDPVKLDLEKEPAT